jgi:hypothetical protein
MRILLVAILVLPIIGTRAQAQYYQNPQHNPCGPIYGNQGGLLGMALNAMQQQQRMQDCQRYQQYEQQKALMDQQQRAAQQAAEQQRAVEEQAARAVAQRKADAARAEAQQRSQLRAQQVAVAQEAYEKSPDNVCRSPEVAQDMMDEATTMQKRDYGNLFKNLYGREFPEILDIEHLVTVKNDSANKDLVCHGTWVYSNGTKIAGFFEARPNVANRLIVIWRPGDWTPDVSIVTNPAPAPFNNPRTTMEASANPSKPDWYHH